MFKQFASQKNLTSLGKKTDKKDGRKRAPQYSGIFILHVLTCGPNNDLF